MPRLNVPKQQNLARYSNNINNAVWVKEGLTVTSDAYLGFDALVETAAVGLHRTYQIITSFPLGRIYTATFKAKKADNRYLHFFSSIYTAVFDLDNGSIYSNNALYGTSKLISDGLYEFSVTWQLRTGTTVIFGTSASNSSISYTGTAGKVGCYIGEISVAQTNYSFPYVETTTPAVNTGGIREAVFKIQNLILDSEDVTAASWSKTNVTATLSGITPPVGCAGVTEITTDTTAFNFFHPATAIAVTRSVPYTLEFYVRAGSYSTLAVTMSDGIDGGVIDVYKRSGPGSVSIAGSSASISGLTSEWTKIAIVRKYSIGNFIRPLFYPGNTSTGTAGNNLYFTGCHFIEGYNLNATYVKTTSAAVNTGALRQPIASSLRTQIPRVQNLNPNSVSMLAGTNYVDAAGLVVTSVTGLLDKFGQPMFNVVPTAVAGFHDIRLPMADMPAAFKLDGVMKYGSIIMKANGYNYAWIYFNSGSPYDAFHIDLTTGATGLIGTPRTKEGLNITTRNLGDGQWLIDWQFRSSINSTAELGINAVAGTYASFTGDGTSGVLMSSLCFSETPLASRHFVATSGSVVNNGPCRPTVV